MMFYHFARRRLVTGNQLPDASTGSLAKFCSPAGHAYTAFFRCGCEIRRLSTSSLQRIWVTPRRTAHLVLKKIQTD
jgi:hypothetical protein